MRFAAIVFPGSNCDHDTEHVLRTVLGQDCELVWHTARSLRRFDVIVVPGGFTYGDYLRTGAIARFSPVMKAIVEHARRGKPVIGICNGFQILCEAGLLPGAFARNLSLKFVCRHVHVRVENTSTPFTGRCYPGQVLRMPVAHGEGRYTANAATLKRLERTGRVIFRYCDQYGETSAGSNPNGSSNAIAGVAGGLAGNVVGLMPHPERSSEEVLGSADGRLLFESVIESLTSPLGVSSK